MLSYVVRRKIKKFMLFSLICLTKSVSFASCQVFKADTVDNHRVDGGPLTIPLLSFAKGLNNLI